MTNLSEHLVFHDAGLKRRFANQRMPMATLYEAYFDGDIDIRGDIFDFLSKRDELVDYSITRRHLSWALTNFAPEVLLHSRSQDRRIVRDHYDRGDDFFGWFLGERMVYSSAFFRDPGESLEQAQDNKLQRVCDKLELRSGERLLDIGCGWGTLARFAAERYAADVTGLTISERQASFGNARLREAGQAERARILCDDYRNVSGGPYDKIVSLEMVEHVGLKNLVAFYRRVRELLADDGLFVLQWTGLRRDMWFRPEDLIWGMFMNKYIFPGADASLCPSPMFRALERAGFETYSVENVSSHYSLTIRRWHDNWLKNREAVLQSYGERWFRIFNLFLAWSSLIALKGTSACFQVVLHKNLDAYDRARFAGASRAAPSASRACQSSATR